MVLGSKIARPAYLRVMKNIIAILSCFLLFNACHTPDNTLRAFLSGTDSVAINYFTGDGRMNTVKAVKIIKERQNIEKLIKECTAEKLKEEKRCGVDGSLHFFRHDTVIADIYFRMNDEKCRRFWYVFKGKSAATRLGSNASALLANILQQK